MNNPNTIDATSLAARHAIVLGGTVAHAFLINNLKQRGYRTVLVDYYDRPPAADAADEHIQASTLDQQAVIEIARHKKACLVIAGCVDQANATACFAAERLGLPSPYSYETAVRVTDKTLMKAGMINAGIPTADYTIVSENDLDSCLVQTYPAVVKPCDCNGSKGVRSIRNDTELRLAVKQACSLSRTGRAIVESMNQGKEISGYFFIDDSKAHEVYLKEKPKPDQNSGSYLQPFLSVGPAQVSDHLKRNLREAVTRIAREFNLSNTPILMQANVTGDDFKVIEFAPRVGGGLAFREILLLTGFDQIDAVIRSYLHTPVDTSRIQTPQGMICIAHLYATHGVFDHVEGMERLVAEGVVEEFHLHKTPGTLVGGSDLASGNRVLGAILRGDTASALQNKFRRLVAQLRIISSEGADLLRRDILA